MGAQATAAFIRTGLIAAAMGLAMMRGSAQQGQLDTTRVRRIELMNGSAFEGRILTVDSTGLRLRKMDGSSVRIAAAMVRSMRDTVLATELATEVQRPGAWLDRTASSGAWTSLNLLPSGRTLKRDQVCLSAFWPLSPLTGPALEEYGFIWHDIGPIYPNLSFGLTDGFEVGVGGMHYLGRDPRFVFVVSGKSSLYRDEQTALAVGWAVVYFGTTKDAALHLSDWDRSPIPSVYIAYTRELTGVAVTCGAGISAVASALSIGAEIPLDPSIAVVVDGTFGFSMSSHAGDTRLFTATLRCTFSRAAVAFGAFTSSGDVLLDFHGAYTGPWAQCSFVF
jgi:hypothetical protein